MAIHDGYRARLQAEQARLEQELATLASTAGGREHGSYATHSADDATETFDQEQSLALARHLEGALDQVERALQKLAAGSYGRCDRCGVAIDDSRLAALPYALLCLSCQTKLERQR